MAKTTWIKVKNKEKGLCSNCFEEHYEYVFLKNTLFTNIEINLCVECLKIKLAKLGMV